MEINLRNYEVKFISNKTGLAYNIFKLPNSNIIKSTCMKDGNLLYEKYYNVNDDKTFNENVDLLKIHNSNFLESFADDIKMVVSFVNTVVEYNFNN